MSSQVSNYESTDEEIDDEELNFNFCKTGKVPEKYNSSARNIRSETQGPTDPFLFKKSVLDIWESIFSPVIDIIVAESNLFATQKHAVLDTTREEIRAFIGILIFMGYHNVPTIRLYWSTNHNFYCSRVANVMPLKRFLKLLRYIHLNDNQKMLPRSSDSFDKLFKIRPLIDHLNNIYKILYNPSQNLSVDESMVAFTGRSCMKQYMPLKPIKRGFKVWAMTDSATGYLLSFDVYTGKKKSNKPELGLGENVVLELSKYYTQKYYCLYFDNFFTSIPLMKMLLDIDLFGCGTFRVNKKFYPKHLMKKDSFYKPGEIEFAQSGDISVCRWKDRGKKPVTVISNMHDGSSTEIVNRKNSKGEKVPIECPKSIADYNKFMGGVDRFDQYMATYSISQKSRRWWLKLFYYMLDTSIVNSYLLFKTSCGNNRKKPMSTLEFRSTLTDQLIGNFSSRHRPTISPGVKNPKRALSNPCNYLIPGQHLAVKIDTYRRCKVCSKNKEKRSNILCETCKICLCKDCFAPYHKLPNNI